MDDKVGAYLTRVDWTLLVSFSDKKSKLRETPAKNAMLRMLKIKHKKIYLKRLDRIPLAMCKGSRGNSKRFN
jgi:hypothetical protein